MIWVRLLWNGDGQSLFVFSDTLLSATSDSAPRLSTPIPVGRVVVDDGELHAFSTLPMIPCRPRSHGSPDPPVRRIEPSAK